MLIERCRPGADLWSLPPERAHEVAADVLSRLWGSPERPVGSIGTVADTIAEWNRLFPSTRTRYPKELVKSAAHLGVELVESTTEAVIVHGDFNPFNVLSSHRDGWLAIDPKPLVGDRAYDLAQYLGNCVEEADASGDSTAWMAAAIDHLAAALSLDFGSEGSTV